MYLSWDIGIKNLAYCMMDYDAPSNKFTIHHWGIINLAESDQPKVSHILCSDIIKKTNQKCNKPVSYLDKNDLTIGFCKIHSKKKSNLIDYNPTLTCCHLNKNNQKCIKNATYYHTSNNAIFYCTQHAKKDIQYLNKILKPKKATKIPLFQLSSNLFKILDTHPELLQAKIIILENQPVYKNPTMKSIQIMLYSYFILRGTIEKDKNNSKVDEIVMMSAKNKLKAYQGEPSTKYNHIKSQYNRTKKLAVEYCKIMIQDDLQWYDYFINYAKNKGKGVVGCNDDLADTYLMNCYFILKKYKKI